MLDEKQKNRVSPPVWDDETLSFYFLKKRFTSSLQLSLELPLQEQP